MAERYTKLFSLPENLYEKDCPVMICAGALSKDNQTNKIFVQLRFQNAKCKPYVKEIVGTTWGNNEYIAWDKRSRDEWSGQYWEFTSEKSAIQADWSNNWTTSSHDDYYQDTSNRNIQEFVC